MRYADFSVMMLKTRIEEVMYGTRQSIFLETVLGLLAAAYGLAMLVRRELYQRGIFTRRKLDARVISVGNLTLGGTGKTPAVMQIAQVLRTQGRHPAVISRGYGRQDESAITVVSDGVRLCTDTKRGGDEPVLIGSKLKGIPVIAGSNRFRTGRYARERFGSDTIILDDGFQHMQLRRDLDIVLIDGADPFGRRRLFPAGILREPLSGLSRAHAVLITNADRAGDLDGLKRSIGRSTTAPVFSSRPVPADIVDIVTGESKPLAALRGTGVLAFAGIARPNSFLAMLRSLGADIQAEFFYPDHYTYVQKDLVKLTQRAADSEISMIITTEKDGVRLKDLNPHGIWALRIELEVFEKKEWEAVLLKQR